MPSFQMTLFSIFRGRCVGITVGMNSIKIIQWIGVMKRTSLEGLMQLVKAIVESQVNHFNVNGARC